MSYILNDMFKRMLCLQLENVFGKYFASTIALWYWKTDSKVGACQLTGFFRIRSSFNMDPLGANVKKRWSSDEKKTEIK